MKSRAIGLLAAVLTIPLSGCDQIEKEIFGNQRDSYVECLKSSLTGSHSFSAEEIRSLCQEISMTQNPSYKPDAAGKLVPDNEFTKCYDKHSKQLSRALGIGIARSRDAAQLLCRYGVDLSRTAAETSMEAALNIVLDKNPDMSNAELIKAARKLMGQ